MEFVFEIDHHDEFVFPFVYNSWLAYEQMKWLEDGNDYYQLRLSYNDLGIHIPKKDRIPIGTIQFTHKFMNQLGIDSPEPLNIPDSIQHLTDYPTKETTVEEVKNNTHLPIFIKPKQLKQFDGGVLNSYRPLNHLLAKYQVNEKTPVLIREPFPEDIVVEYRIPVFSNEPFAAQPYNGIYSPHLDWDFINNICNEFDNGRSPYVIDVAVGESGTNYLVELTHFYSISLYGVEDVKLVKAQLRWWLLNVNSKL